jgi:hypothetical protein
MAPMRAVLFVGLLLAACEPVKDIPRDGPHLDDSGDHPDAAVDAAIDSPVCMPQVLLNGAMPVGPQGWATVMQAPSMLTYGPDYVRLETTQGQTTSGQLMLNYPGALTANQPFKLQVVLLVERTSPHNLFDAAVAIMASYTPPFGAGNERGQILYLDGGAVGWAADDTQAAQVAIANNVYHTVELAVDAAGMATVSIDGAMLLTRAGVTTNGAIAIGDQTNDANVDSAIRIRSITKLCP